MKRQWGFTLLEILVALAVFAVIGAITGSAMYYAFDMRSKTGRQSDRLLALQTAISLIERDIEQTSLRMVRGDEMHLFPAFIGRKNYMEFTRGGITNPEGYEQRSTLKRVALLCQNQKLIRRRYARLDTPNRNNYADSVLIDHLEKCQFAYLDSSLQVLKDWRATELPELGSAYGPPLPKAVQVNLTLSDWGQGSFLFIIPEALYGQK